MDEEGEHQPRPEPVAQAAQEYVARDVIAIRLRRPVDKQHTPCIAEHLADVRLRDLRTGEGDLLPVDPRHGDRFLPPERHNRPVAAILPGARRRAANLARQAEAAQKHRGVIERVQHALRRQGAIEHRRGPLPSQAAQHLRQQMLERAATSTGGLRSSRLPCIRLQGSRCCDSVGDVHAATCAGAGEPSASTGESSRPSSTPSRVRMITVVRAETCRRKARSRSTPSLSSA